MKRLAFAAAALIAAACAQTAAAQTVYLVRHAEKADASADPVLSSAGEARAQALSAALADAHPDFILTSPLQRTQLTAGPTGLAHSVRLEPIGFDGGSEAHVARIVERVRAMSPDDVVLIVGHSNTVPLIARALGYAEAADMADCEYDRMTVIHLAASEAHGMVSRYGAPTACE